MQISRKILGLMFIVVSFLHCQNYSDISADSMFKLINFKILNSIGKKAPDIIYQSIEDGSQHHLTELYEHVVLVNFWDIHCIPCLAEMPSLSRLQDDYRSAGFIVLFISPDDSATQSHFIASRKINGIKGRLDLSGVSEPYNIQCEPRSFLINQAGVIKNAWLGDLKYQDIEAKLNFLIPKDKKRARIVSLFYEYIDRIPMERNYIYATVGGIILILAGIILTVVKRKSINSSVA